MVLNIQKDSQTPCYLRRASSLKPEACYEEDLATDVEERLEGQVIRIDDNRGTLRILTKSKAEDSAECDREVQSGQQLPEKIQFRQEEVSGLGGLQLAVGDCLEFFFHRRDERARRPALLSLTQRSSSDWSVFVSSLQEVLDDSAEDPEAVSPAVSRQASNSSDCPDEALSQVLHAHLVWRTFLECPKVKASDVLYVCVFLTRTFREYPQHRQAFITLLESIVEHADTVKFFRKLLNENGNNDRSVLFEFLRMSAQLVPTAIISLLKIVEPVISGSSCDLGNLLHHFLKRYAILSSAGDEPFSSWRDLPVFPRELEIRDESGIRHLKPALPNGPYSSMEEYLETNFRLLRAECFEGLLQGIRDLQKGTVNFDDVPMYKNVRILGVRLSSIMQPMAIKIQVETVGPPVKNWDNTPRLSKGNLLCLSPESDFKTLLWATVADRNSSELSNCQSVWIELCQENQMTHFEVFQLLMARQASGLLMAESMVLLDAYAPVLQRLQRFVPDRFILQEPIVFANMNEAFQQPLSVAAFYRKHRKTPPVVRIVGTSLDANLQKAFDNSINRRLSVLEAPPGTLKNNVLLPMIKQILSLQQEGRSILLLSKSSHSLEEILTLLQNEKALSGKMIKLGGSQKEEFSTQRISLNFMKKDRVRFPYPVTIRDRRFQLHDQQMRLKKELKNKLIKFDKSRQFSPDVLLRQCTEEQIRNLFVDCAKSTAKFVKILRYDAEKQRNTFIPIMIEDLLSEIEQQQKQNLVQVLSHKTNDTAVQVFEAIVEKWLPRKEVINRLLESMSTINQALHQTTNKSSENETDHEDFDETAFEAEILKEQRMHDLPDQHQGHRGDFVIDFSTLLPSSMSLNDEKGSSDEKHGSLLGIHHLITAPNMWFFSEKERTTLIQILLLKSSREMLESLKATMNDYVKVSRMCKEVQQQYEAGIVKAHPLILSTVSSAMLHRHLLDIVKPGTVIVQEAEMVAESHLLSCLTETTEQLILISDGRQLPANDSDFLSKRYKSHLALTTRLTNNGLQVDTLKVQNQMNSKISRLMQEFYPEIEDHPKANENNPPPDCLTKAVSMWTHDYPEKKTKSYSNLEETKRAVSLALFLISQGLQAEDIGILTVYKSQAALIKKGLKQTVPKYRHLWQKSNYRRYSVIEANAEKPCREEDSIFVGTLDSPMPANSKNVIIFSMVRSNDAQTLGSIRYSSYLCSLLSRTRSTLIFIGNASTFSGDEVWKSLTNKLSEDDAVGPLLTIRCPKHTDVSIETISDASDMPIERSFCPITCVEDMACKVHRCLRSCQPLHDHRLCKVEVPYLFPQCQHLMTKFCYQDVRHLKCTEKVRFVFSTCGHETLKECHLPEQALTCSEPCTRQLGCGHQCPQRCGDQCDLRMCRDCREQEEADKSKDDGFDEIPMRKKIRTPVSRRRHSEFTGLGVSTQMLTYLQSKVKTSTDSPPASSTNSLSKASSPSLHDEDYEPDDEEEDKREIGRREIRALSSDQEEEEDDSFDEATANRWRQKQTGGGRRRHSELVGMGNHMLAYLQSAALYSNK